MCIFSVYSRLKYGSLVGISIYLSFYLSVIPGSGWGQGSHRSVAAAYPGDSDQLQREGGVHSEDHGDGGGGPEGGHASYTGQDRRSKGRSC